MDDESLDVDNSRARKRTEKKAALPVIMPTDDRWEKEVAKIAKEHGYPEIVVRGKADIDEFSAAATQRTILAIQRLPGEEKGKTIDLEPAMMSALVASSRAKTVDHGPVADLDQDTMRDKISRAIEEIAKHSDSREKPQRDEKPATKRD